jgi:hypothetical protein
MQVNVNKDSGNSGGITFFGLLQIVFIVLKLCGVIKWSWWLVLIPLWIDLGLIAIIILLIILANK